MLINFNEVSDEEVVFELIPEGKHILKVTKCESKVSEKTGNEYWSIIFENKDEQRVYDNLFFTEKTLNRVKKMFKCLGLDVEGSFDYDCEDIVGRYINADVLIEDYTYNGVDKQKNVINLWGCEPYETAPVTKKVAPKKPTKASEELPF